MENQYRITNQLNIDPISFFYDNSFEDYTTIQEIPEWMYKRLSDVLFDLKRMHVAGYTAIAYSVMLCEDTFIFETQEEAYKAGEIFEINAGGSNVISGWWYGWENFLNQLPRYETEQHKKLEYVRLDKPFIVK